MAYTKQNFRKKQVLKAEHLNRMENGISDAIKIAENAEKKAGKDGYTPVKGVDYYTEEDKREFEKFIVEEMAKREQISPEFANSIEECVDTSKLYVLPDGYFYAYMYSEVAVESGENILPSLTPLSGLTNDGTGLYYGYYASSNSPGYGSDANCTITGAIPCTKPLTLYIKGVTSLGTSSHDRVLVICENGALWTFSLNTTTDYATLTEIAEGYYSLELMSALTEHINSTIKSPIASVVLSIDNTTSSDEIMVSYEPFESGTTIGYQWTNTGRELNQYNCEDRIIELETENEQLKTDLASAEQRITDLENAEIADGIEDYVKEEAERVAKNVYAHQNANTFTFFAISDIHELPTHEQITTGNLHAGQGMELIRKAVRVDFAACLGDNGWGSAVEGSDNRATIESGIAEIRSANAKIDNAFSGIPNFRTVGNHCPIVQNYEFNGGEYLDENRLFPLYGAYNTSAVYPKGEKDRGYCYRDFEDWKLRVICMNSSDLKGLDPTAGNAVYTSGAQLKWFAEVLDMSDKSNMDEWHILIFSHLPLDYYTSRQTVDILKAYLEGSSVALTKDDIEINYDYSGKNGATVIANIHGHNHCFNVDNLYINSDADTKIDVKRICIPNACFSRTNERGENGALDQGDIEYGDTTSYEKVEGTAEDTAFNVITIDPVARKIYADNYGAGIDREISY